MFALARNVNLDKGCVSFENWCEPRHRRCVEVTLAENATLNLFLTPRSMAAVVESGRLTQAVLSAHVDSLCAKGLLLTEQNWLDERARHPYAIHPSVWNERSMQCGAYADYEDAYQHDAAPWNQLPVAVDVLAMAPIPALGTARLLDVGCGSGHNLRLTERLGFQCWGIDVSATAIARARAITSHPENFVAGTVAELPWPDDSFELVTDIGCLHCLSPDEIAAYVREVRRVLRPGGRFLCRCFKPRTEDLVKAQPVRMNRLGYDPGEVQDFFANALPVEMIKEGPVHGYFQNLV